MCALFGWLDCGKKLPHKLLKKLTQELANAAEERGTDASGISYVKNGKVNIYKKPKPAHKVRFDFPKGASAIMGHTRLTTQGNQKFNFNNHPFYGHADKKFTLAHNGVLCNDKELRRIKNLPETHIETDSYVAVQLIEKSGKLDFISLKSMAENVQGSFTFTILDENNTLYFIKGSSPMYLIYFENLDFYAYASTESIMTKALEKSGFAHLKYQLIQLHEGNIISIDRFGKIECAEFKTDEFNYLRFWDNYTCEEELLLEMCGCFGVSEEDIILLMDYGYTFDEIEEMLMDSDLIQETVAELKYAY
ncbi:MAG: glucosamine 6-phosphate synthetase [Clostridium sp.]|nr:glucosamine 6-phosphate synthetase [Clostridium sp.]